MPSNSARLLPAVSSNRFASAGVMIHDRPFALAGLLLCEKLFSLQGTWDHR